MKEQFKEFYENTEEEVGEIWESAIFIFDTNILTGLYRLPEDLRSELLKILKELATKKRIWLPHHVLHEFHKNRRGVIIGLENDYNEAVHAIEGLINELPKKVEKKLKSACDQHPLLKFDDFYREAEKGLNNITEKIKSIKEKHPKWKEKDEVLPEIEKIFTNFGKEYSHEELQKIFKEGENRYRKLVPPGFKDCKNNGGEKEGDSRFGDLIIWNQILDYAKKNKKGIVFITNDRKEDWWIKEYDKVVGPRFELKKEFYENSKMEFDMCDLDMFLEKSKKYLNSNINSEQIQKIREIKRFDEERFITNRQENARITRNYYNGHLEAQKINISISPVLEELEYIFNELLNLDIIPLNNEIHHQLKRIRYHNRMKRKDFIYILYRDIREFLESSEHIVMREGLNPEILSQIIKFMRELDLLANRLIS